MYDRNLARRRPAQSHRVAWDRSQDSRKGGITARIRRSRSTGSSEFSFIRLMATDLSRQSWQLHRSRIEIDLSGSVLPFAEVQRLEAVHLLYPIHERAFLFRV